MDVAIYQKTFLIQWIFGLEKLRSYLSWNWSEAQTFVLHPVLFLVAGGWEQSIIIHVLSIFSGIKFILMKFPESFLFNSGKLMVYESFWDCCWIWLGHNGRLRFCGTSRLHNLEDTIKKTIQKYLWKTIRFCEHTGDRASEGSLSSSFINVIVICFLWPQGVLKGFPRLTSFSSQTTLWNSYYLLYTE